MKNKGKATMPIVGGPDLNSKDDSGVEEAKQKPAMTEEVVSTTDDEIVDVFNKVREILAGSDGATRAIVETQAEEIKKLKRTVEGHGTMLEMLWSEYAKGRERPLTHKERYGSKKGSAVDDRNNKNMEVKRNTKPGSQDVDDEAVTNDVDAIMSKIGAGNNAVNTTRDHAKKSDNKKRKRPPSQRSSAKQQQLKRRLEFLSGDSSSGHSVRRHGEKEVSLFYRVGAPGFMDGGDLPHCIDVVFRPPAGVNFVTVELAVAAYVFGRRLSMKEVLIPNDHCQGDREALWTLRPGEEVVDDVLNLLATMLTDDKADRRIWWLPTTFAQVALNPVAFCKETLSFITKRYMGRADDLTKIFVPMHLNGHWYLMIVDIQNECLIYLDSLKSQIMRDGRINQMYFVARYIQQLLREGDFYARPGSKPPQITDFKFSEPVTGQQAPMSNDCGIWVAQWMELSHLWGFFDLERVDDETRIRLAVDLVMSKSNPKRDEVCQKAGYFWDNSVKSYWDNDGCDPIDGGPEDATAGSMSSQRMTI